MALNAKATITVSYTTYEWWLLTWSNSQVVCQIYVEHEGWPETEEVQYYCGDKVLNDWLQTSPCVLMTISRQPNNVPASTYIRLASPPVNVRSKWIFSRRKSMWTSPTVTPRHPKTAAIPCPASIS